MKILLVMIGMVLVLTACTSHVLTARTSHNDPGWQQYCLAGENITIPPLNSTKDTTVTSFCVWAKNATLYIDGIKR